MGALPVIDVAALVTGVGDVDAVATAIDRACRDRGFFVIVGHGAPSAALAELDAAARRFFALPVEDKAEIEMARAGPAWRGWFPEGGELTSGKPDRKEGVYYGRDLPPDDPRVRAGTLLHGANLHPAAVPELRSAVDRWMAEMERVADALARGVSLALGLGSTWIGDHLTAEPTILFRIFRYPTTDDDSWGVAEHTDYGLLTLLAHDGRPGLEVRTRDGAGWTPVPAVDGGIVVNIGDMLERMTGGAYRSTPHRVRHVGRPGEPDRLSFPFFFDPSWDAVVAPLPLDEASDAHRDGVGSGAHDRWDGRSPLDWEGPYGRYLSAKVARAFPGLSPR